MTYHIHMIFLYSLIDNTCNDLSISVWYGTYISIYITLKGYDAYVNIERLGNIRLLVYISLSTCIYHTVQLFIKFHITALWHQLCLPVRGHITFSVSWCLWLRQKSITKQLLFDALAFGLSTHCIWTFRQVSHVKQDLLN